MIPPFALTLLAGLSVLSATIPVVSGFTPPDFGYTNLLSALNWQNLNVTAYSACAEGLIQSPIDLNDTIAFASQNPLVHIPPLNKAVLQNTGVLVEIVYPTGFGLTVYNGTTWQIDNFHFHAPGEHRVYQEFFPVEMHIVNSDVSTSP
jgi:carbonic anhydrase